MDPDPQKIKNLLQGLGKATNRGIKKCPKCGTYNGTRGVFCKNVMCDNVLKNVEDENYKALIKACKLITDDRTHVFSVRINEKGTDQRGFVQLPLNNSSKGLCFIDECPKTFDSEILKVHEKGQNTSEKNSTPCQHIEAAKNCVAFASSIALNPVIIDSIKLSPMIREGLCDLISDFLPSSGSIVQRISKTMFVVKCKTSSKHPLGYLHLTIYNNVKHKDKPDYRHYCPCPVECKDTSSIGSEDVNERKCVHYYAAICSFASDEKLSEEFSHFLDSEQMLTWFVNLATAEEDTDQLVAIFGYNPDILAAADNVSMSEEPQDVQLIAPTSDTDTSNLKILSSGDINSVYTYLIDNSSTDGQLVATASTMVQNRFLAQSSRDESLPILATQNDGRTESLLIINSNTDFKSKKRKLQKITSSVSKEKVVKPSGSSVKNVGNNVSETAHKRLVKYMAKKPSTRTVELMEDNLKREELVSTEFLRWVGSIAERIHLEMHYQFECNRPKILTFFPTPMNFFDCLRERLATIGPKRRLPNSTVAFVSKKPPVGTFTKFTWQLTSIIHVKQVLDNPFFPLRLTRNFVSSGNGMYSPSKTPPREPAAVPDLGDFPKIKPFELTTYLKVGNMSPNQFDPTPFIIEYIPDLLPTSRIGELKISFEYGHLKPSYGK